MNKKLSISDDDICSTCKYCIYNLGELSSCEKDWPAFFIHGYARTCDDFEKITNQFENWSKEALNYMTDSLITD